MTMKGLEKKKRYSAVDVAYLPDYYMTRLIFLSVKFARVDFVLFKLIRKERARIKAFEMWV